MHLSKNILGCALLASALSVGSSYAEQLVNFHLPVPVKWGNSTLEPGNYRMEIPTSTAGVQSVCMRNAQKSVVALPLATSSVEPRALSNKSYLQLVNVNGTYFVRKYISGMTGRTLLFGVPKVHNDSIARNMPQNITEIEGSN
jgi:hypothetical protein